MKCIFNTHEIPLTGVCDNTNCHQNVRKECSIINEIHNLKRLFYIFSEERAYSYIMYVLGEMNAGKADR